MVNFPSASVVPLRDCVDTGSEVTVTRTSAIGSPVLVFFTVPSTVAGRIWACGATIDAIKRTSTTFTIPSTFQPD
jgi:hypothetical protein